MTHLIPSSFAGRLLLAASLAIAAGMYGLRLLVSAVLDSATIVFLACCLLPLPTLAFLALTARHGLQAGGHPAPLIALVLGLLLAIILPAPPPMNEPRFFATQRGEYEQLVNLARGQRLAHSRMCAGGRAFAAPPEYEQLSKYCIKVDSEPIFSVQFSPLHYERLIVYIDDPARIAEVFGCDDPDGQIQQLEENWFFCSTGS